MCRRLSCKTDRADQGSQLDFELQRRAASVTPRQRHGFPLSANGQVTLANWRQAPFSRWAFHHVRELVPSAEIANDPDDVHEWPIDRVEIGHIPIEADGIRPLSFDEF